MCVTGCRGCCGEGLKATPHLFSEGTGNQVSLKENLKQDTAHQIPGLLS